MTSRTPTRKQFGRLLLLGSGAVVLSPTRNEWRPLRNHGWIEDATSHTTAAYGAPFGGAAAANWYLPPQRITPHGLRALADGLETHGWPAREEERS